MAEEKKFLVYVHRNKINGKMYFGITSRKAKTRWGKDGCYYQSSPHFYSAIKKYGWNTFEHNILFEELPEPCAKALEKILIRLFDTTNPSSGYNISEGGDGYTGSHPKASEATKKRMSEAHKGMFLNGPCAKGVIQYDLDGNIIKEWPSTIEIQRVLGFRNANISRCCRGERKTAYKYVWKYKAE